MASSISIRNYEEVKIRRNEFPAHVISASREKRYNSVDYSLFLTMGQVSNYSCLMPWQIPQNSAAIMTGLMGKSTPNYIIDAGANIGCDTVHLARLFPYARISAIEIDPETFRCLTKNVTGNISALGVDEWRVDIHLGDALKLIPKLTAENIARFPAAKIMIYFDPPWGGPDYKKLSKIKLFFGGQEPRNISEYSLELLANNQCDFVLLKVPFNFDFDDLSTLLEKYNSLETKKISEQIVFSTHAIKKAAKESTRENKNEKEDKKGGVEYFLVLLQKLKKLSL